MPEDLCPRPDKVRWQHKTLAKRALRKWLGKISTLHVYRCPCGYFHLGHKRGL